MFKALWESIKSFIKKEDVELTTDSIIAPFITLVERLANHAEDTKAFVAQHDAEMNDEIAEHKAIIESETADHLAVIALLQESKAKYAAEAEKADATLAKFKALFTHD